MSVQRVTLHDRIRLAVEWGMAESGERDFLLDALDGAVVLSREDADAIEKALWHLGTGSALHETDMARDDALARLRAAKGGG